MVDLGRRKKYYGDPSSFVDDTLALILEVENYLKMGESFYPVGARLLKRGPDMRLGESIREHRVLPRHFSQFQFLRPT